ncbi:MAG: response regulator [Xanthomonadaceae bacterium]|nr:response regulator [Xanthomonadaceae bacterium]
MQEKQSREKALSRVLFVDDSRLMRFAGQRMLRPVYDIVIAEDGREAWKALRQDHRIDLLITDLNMPKMDGVELIERVRGSRVARIRRLPILVVTGAEERNGRERARAAGADRLIAKPFAASDLIDSAAELLRRANVLGGSSVASPQAAEIMRSRDGLVERLEQTMSLYLRHAFQYSLLHVRLDNYDEVASRLGSDAAESMMRHLRRALGCELRTEDVVARSCRSMFSIILMASREAGARRVRERVRLRLADRPLELQGCSVELRASFVTQGPPLDIDSSASTVFEAGLSRFKEPPNVTRLADRFPA